MRRQNGLNDLGSATQDFRLASGVRKSRQNPLDRGELLLEPLGNIARVRGVD
jgi:hypothetical protein